MSYNFRCHNNFLYNWWLNVLLLLWNSARVHSIISSIKQSFFCATPFYGASNDWNRKLLIKQTLYSLNSVTDWYQSFFKSPYSYQSVSETTQTSLWSKRCVHLTQQKMDGSQCRKENQRSKTHRRSLCYILIFKVLSDANKGCDN